MIKLRNLNKYFFKNKKNEIHVLNNVSLDLESSGLIAIHGPSGSGKTTLLNVVGGLDKVNSGEILFEEKEFKKYNAKVWDQIRSEHIGYIFQNYYLLPELSVYENIRFVLKLLGIKDEKYIESRVHYVLKAVGMYKYRKKKALQLSGGQQQRVAIARALVKNPKVVIADEPTGNLDSKNTVEIMNIINEIAKDKLVILVTHEKELANIYADRIIEIEDGKIVGDYYNEQKDEHNITDDTIYLKDYSKQKTLKDEHLKIDLYTEEEVKDLNLKLIVKNDTLYLDVLSGFKNVKLADKSSGILIKDEHYVKKTTEEAILTDFKTVDVDHSNVKKEKTIMVSFKQSFMMAFEKILMFGRRGKLMLFSFFVAGLIIAFSIATFAALAIARPEPSMSISKGYVEFANYLPDDNISYSYKELSEKLNTDNTYMYMYDYVVITFLNADNSDGYKFWTRFDFDVRAKDYKLKQGRYGNNPSEIVVTTALVKQIFAGDANDYGIWNVDQLFKEKIKLNDTYANIVGVVESDILLAFADELFLLSTENHLHKPLEIFDDVSLKYGRLPNDDEVLVSETYINNFGYYNLDELTYPILMGNGRRVSGIHGLNDDYSIFTKETIKRNRIISSNRLFVYTKNKNETINLLEKEFDLVGIDHYDNLKAEIKADNLTEIIGALTTTLIFLGISLVGFYFIIRSSLVKRIYEVAVYRALGVKKRDIFSSFIVETLLITTITTFVGYSLMSLILYKVQQGIIGELNYVYVNFLSYIVGAIILYGINLIAGLLPVFTLLRKTPAQILSQYDI